MWRLFLLECLILFPFLASADADNDARVGESDEPTFSNLNGEEKEAAERLWASFAELKNIHKDFQSAFDLSQTMFDEVIGASRGPTRFIQAKVRSKNPVDPEKIRRGGYATQQPRTPPEMKVRIFDGVDEEQRDQEITEESQKVLAAHIRDSVDDEIENMERETREVASDTRVKTAADALLTSLAAAAASQPPTEEEAADAVDRIVASKTNPGAHQVPPAPAHSAGRVPPCQVQVAFRQKDDGPIDLSQEAFRDTKVQAADGDSRPTAMTMPDEDADSAITVVAPFKPTVPRSFRISPPKLKEGGVPNGFYGPSRSFL